VFASPLKARLLRIPLKTVSDVSKRSKKPVVAIGGITDKNAKSLKKAGIKTVAFMRYALAEKETAKKIAKLRDLL